MRDDARCELCDHWAYDNRQIAPKPDGIDEAACCFLPPQPLPFMGRPESGRASAWGYPICAADQLPCGCFMDAIGRFPEAEPRTRMFVERPPAEPAQPVTDEPPEILEAPLALSSRATRAMEAIGAETPEELAAFTRADLDEIEDVGYATLAELAAYLDLSGLAFAAE